MSWEVEFLDEARRDMRRLDGAQRVLVLKAAREVVPDPLIPWTYRQRDYRKGPLS
ncbi:type II toxin-antitoxin system RelE/ParE family toxin [Adlercreutzia sp. ZJ242]|uniref:type II toxin-antitoxin system RelE family toxin n=1 Tax=Adlercreutzia sp. ZJ242 TaxID=2709409 RepID=UPI0013EE10B7|nr:hypothetical protein [Adlercreutzia sp. ZJ242]